MASLSSCCLPSRAPTTHSDDSSIELNARPRAITTTKRHHFQVPSLPSISTSSTSRTRITLYFGDLTQYANTSSTFASTSSEPANGRTRHPAMTTSNDSLALTNATSLALCALPLHSQELIPGSCLTFQLLSPYHGSQFPDQGEMVTTIHTDKYNLQSSWEVKSYPINLRDGIGIMTLTFGKPGDGGAQVYLVSLEPGEYGSSEHWTAGMEKDTGVDGLTDVGDVGAPVPNFSRKQLRGESSSSTGSGRKGGNGKTRSLPRIRELNDEVKVCGKWWEVKAL